MNKIYHKVPLETKVIDLKTGDGVQAIDGTVREIRSIGKGMYTYPSKLITFTDGEWSNQFDNDTVLVHYKTVEEE